MDRGLTRVDSLEKVGGNWLACLYIKIYYKTSRIKIDFIGIWIERLASVTEFPEIDTNIYIYIYIYIWILIYDKGNISRINGVEIKYIPSGKR